MAANPAALNWKQWLPTVDDAFAWAFLLGFKRGITAGGLCQAVCLALNALHWTSNIHWGPN